MLAQFSVEEEKSIENLALASNAPELLRKLVEEVALLREAREALEAKRSAGRELGSLLKEAMRLPSRDAAERGELVAKKFVEAEKRLEQAEAALKAFDKEAGCGCG